MSASPLVSPVQLPPVLPSSVAFNVMSYMQATPRLTSPFPLLSRVLRLSSQQPTGGCTHLGALLNPTCPNRLRHLLEHLFSNHPTSLVLPDTWVALRLLLQSVHGGWPSWSAWQVGETRALEFKSQPHHLLRPVTLNLLEPASRVCWEGKL